MNITTRLDLEDSLSRASMYGSGKMMLLRPEEKSAECMVELVCKFCKAEELVLDI